MGYPKWLHKGWKATEKSYGHFEPTASKLVHSAEQEKWTLSKGYGEAVPAVAPLNESEDEAFEALAPKVSKKVK